jgi:omega-6 fatty acid desaturase (delta-12 desaturase)
MSLFQRHPISVPESASSHPNPSTQPGKANDPVPQTHWCQMLSKYEKPDPRKAVGQLLDTFIPYLGLWILMVCLLRSGCSYLLILPLMVVTAGLLVRIFIFFHDCGHGSFFASRKANTIVGYLCGVLTFTPYEEWRHSHAKHHATAADLDRRGVGDVWTLTVEEYQAAPRRTQRAYRLYRHPFVMFVVTAPVVFMILQRFPHKGATQRDRTSVILTNLGILTMVVIGSLIVGLRTYLSIQLPIMAGAAIIGFWMFYVQHQFEGARQPEGIYWARHQDWDPIRAALEGSSYYKLPKVLQWFSGNIGLHHVHHLRPRIPNYNLQQCHNEIPALQAVEPLTLGRSFKSLWLNLWDENAQQLVSFRSIAG